LEQKIVKIKNKDSKKLYALKEEL